MVTRGRGCSAVEFPTLYIKPLSESDIENIVVRAGGCRAHPDADRRKVQGADFIIGNAVIELKILEEEGLEKPERQKKLAALFSAKYPGRPTVVIDKSLLSEKEGLDYDKIFEGPIKTAIATARKQLRQSKAEFDSETKVLWIVNNGYTSINHDELLSIVARRVRNDTREIDGAIVSGVYYYSDTFDNFFSWKIDYVPINLNCSHEFFDGLKSKWDMFVADFMTSFMKSESVEGLTKGPMIDISFLVDGVMCVRPAPQMGMESDIFINGRPRSNSTGITSCPSVATVFAGISCSEWEKFKKSSLVPISCSKRFEWIKEEEYARSKCLVKPLITMPITYAGWSAWAESLSCETSNSVHKYATEIFKEKLDSIIQNARERTKMSILPLRYLLLITEEIGRDLRFDISHLSEVYTLPDRENERSSVIWENKSMFFEHALCVAAAEAVARGIEYVFWEKITRYAWR